MVRATKPTKPTKPAKLWKPRVVQSGVVPYRVNDGGLEVLLITNRRGHRWLVPKGHVERDRSMRAVALNEAYEEAGVFGPLDAGPPLGAFHYCKGGRRRKVVLYAMRVAELLATWPEAEDRQRVWLPHGEAAAQVDFPGLGACIRRLSLRAFDAAGTLSASRIVCDTK